MKPRIFLTTAILSLGILIAIAFSSQPNQPIGQKQEPPASPSQITLLTPNGGEKWKAGETYTISWSEVKDAGSYDLFFSGDKGNTWETLAQGIENGATSYDWKVSAPASDECLVKVSAKTPISVEIVDQSDNPFTIVKGEQTPK